MSHDDFALSYLERAAETFLLKRSPDHQLSHTLSRGDHDVNNGAVRSPWRYSRWPDLPRSGSCRRKA